MKRTTYLLVWTVALSALVSCVAGNAAVDVEPAVLESEPEPVVEAQELDEPEAAIVEEEPATDDAADRPAQSVELDADSIVLAHSDGITQPDDVEDWVAFTTAPAESEVDVTWVTLACIGEEDAVRAVRMTLWDAGGELDVFKVCSASPKALELEAGHDYLARVHFRDEGAFSADYSLTVSHTTQGLVAQPFGQEDWVVRQLSDATPTVSFEGEAGSPSTSTNLCCGLELPEAAESDDILRDAWMSISCVGDSQAFELLLNRRRAPCRPTCLGSSVLNRMEPRSMNKRVTISSGLPQ
jgi:hypothetical protein